MATDSLAGTETEMKTEIKSDIKNTGREKGLLNSRGSRFHVE